MSDFAIYDFQAIINTSYRVWKYNDTIIVSLPLSRWYYKSYYDMQPHLG